MTKRAQITTSIAGRVRTYDTYQHKSDSNRVLIDVVRTSAPTPTTKHIKIDEKTHQQKKPIIRPSYMSIVPTQRKDIYQKEPAHVRHHQVSNPHSPINIAFNTEQEQIGVASEVPLTQNKSNWTMRLFYVFGSMVFIAAMAVSAQSFISNQDIAEQTDILGAQTLKPDEQGIAEGTGSDPAEQKPHESAFFNYRVAAEKPRYLRIPSLSTYSRIKETGSTSGGAVDSPWNVHDSSWYKESVLPGSKRGVSLILGHVSGRATPGVFKKIGQLKLGDTIEVEKGDGDVIKYTVERTEEYTLKDLDMAKVLYEVPANMHSLRLMTCSGEYNRDTEEYGSRTIVYAKPII